MTVSTKRFHSEYGFETAGFAVSNGMLRVASLETNQIAFGGNNNSITIVDGVVNIKSKTGSSGLIDNMVVGSITPVSGTFTSLSVITAVNLSPSGTVIINPVNIGSIDNVTIGSNIPSTATFTTLESSSAQFNSASISNATITTLNGTSLTFTTANTTTVNATNINVVANVLADNVYVNNDVAASSITADLITVDDIIINNEPTSSNQGTRKSYVDRTAIAFAVALGG